MASGERDDRAIRVGGDGEKLAEKWRKGQRNIAWWKSVKSDEEWKVKAEINCTGTTTMKRWMGRDE